MIYSVMSKYDNEIYKALGLNTLLLLAANEVILVCASDSHHQRNLRTYALQACQNYSSSFTNLDALLFKCDKPETVKTPYCTGMQISGPKLHNAKFCLWNNLM